MSSKMTNSRIEEIIDQIVGYIDNCKFSRFHKNEILVDKDQLLELLEELRLKTPEEIKRVKRIFENKDSIIQDAKEQAEHILHTAQIQTEELINEHEIMQRAYAQANDLLDRATMEAQAILDKATEDSNMIRSGAVQYTDDMLAQLQTIITHSIKDNQEKFTSLQAGLDSILTVVNNNRNELNGISEEAEANTAMQNGEVTSTPEQNLQAQQTPQPTQSVKVSTSSKDISLPNTPNVSTYDKEIPGDASIQDLIDANGDSDDDILG